MFTINSPVIATTFALGVLSSPMNTNIASYQNTPSREGNQMDIFPIISNFEEWGFDSTKTHVCNSDSIQYFTLLNFAEKFITSLEDSDPEIQKAINDFYWDLV